MIDLHIHSTNSDGVLSPIQIAEKAIENGLEYFSISDHDTVAAYNDDLYEFLKDKNINIISGVEISTKFKGVGIHILGYNIDVNNQNLQKRLFESRNSRHIYLSEVAKKLNEIGYYVNVEKLDMVDAVTKAHIAEDIVNNEKNKSLLLKSFGHIPGKGEFIETIMNENCPAYVEKKSISPLDAAKIIRDAGGKVVIAHPVAYVYEDGLNEDDILEIVEAIKPDGIEAYYIYVDKFNNKHNEIERWNAFAKKHGLFTTIGSDFHKQDNVCPSIGFVNEEINITENQLVEIIKNINKKI